MSETNTENAPEIEETPENKKTLMLKKPPTIRRFKDKDGAKHVEFELEDGQSAVVQLYINQLGPANPRFASTYLYTRIGGKYYRHLVEEVVE